jgi:hypothetical protein
MLSHTPSATGQVMDCGDWLNTMKFLAISLDIPLKRRSRHDALSFRVSVNYTGRLFRFDDFSSAARGDRGMSIDFMYWIA